MPNITISSEPVSSTQVAIPVPVRHPFILIYDQSIVTELLCGSLFWNYGSRPGLPISDLMSLFYGIPLPWEDDKALKVELAQSREMKNFRPHLHIEEVWTHEIGSKTVLIYKFVYEGPEEPWEQYKASSLRASNAMDVGDLLTLGNFIGEVGPTFSNVAQVKYGRENLILPIMFSAVGMLIPDGSPAQVPVEAAEVSKDLLKIMGYDV